MLKGKNMNNKFSELPSVCPLDCPDTCSLTVTVNEGKLHKVRGSKSNPFTRGSICNKVSKYYPEFVHGEHRLTQPLLRVGPKGEGVFKPVSWEEALEKVYSGIQEVINQHGAQAVLPLNYAGPHGKLAGGSMDVRFFSRLGSSDLDRSPLCGGVRSLSYQSTYGSAQGMPPEQVEHSDVVLIWGSNVTVSNLHLMRSINRAKKNGAKLIVIDPRETQIAKQADLFLQVTPGSDVVIALKLLAKLDALGLLNQSFPHKVQGKEAFLENAKKYSLADTLKECGVSDDKFEQLVSIMKDAKRLSLSTGVGLERTRNGGAAIRAAQSLPLFIGQLGELGQGILGSYSKAFNANPQLLDKADTERSNRRRIFNIVDVAKHLLDGTLDIPIKAVFIYNHNPIATHPDQNMMRKALAQDSLFTVGCDVQMNDSMKYCDVVLPACTHFEHADVYSSYGHGYLQRADAVIDTVGQSLPNTEIFRRLAEKFGFKESAFTDSDTQLIDQAFPINLVDHGVEKITDMEPEQVINMQSIGRCWLSEHELDTPSGMIELYSKQLDTDYQHPLPNFKEIQKTAEFILISPASAKRINATFGGSSATRNEALEINPHDANRYMIDEGDKVIVTNSLGSVQLIAKVTIAVAEGVVCCEKGAWCESSETGQTVNALISNSSKTDIGDGAAYYDTFVDIQKVNNL
jgi:anaerobic selenocysteine-containing dehydrogenase